MKRFFDPLPKYDTTQLQTYLQILGYSEGELIEHLRKKEELETRTTIVKRDEELWNSKLKPSLLEFASELNTFMEDEELQKKFIHGGNMPNPGFLGRLDLTRGLLFDLD